MSRKFFFNNILKKVAASAAVLCVFFGMTAFSPSQPDGQGITTLPETNNPSETICGDISTHTTWQTGTDYIISCPVTLEAGKTLTIQKGVMVYVDSTINTASLQVYGTLIVNGTSTEKVTFTSFQSSPYPGIWDRIHFYAGSTGDINHAIVEYAGRSTRAAIQVDGGNVTVRNSTIRYSAYQGIRSKVWITAQNNIFTNNLEEAFLLAQPSGGQSSPVIRGNTGSGNGDDRMHIMLEVPQNTTLGENPGLPYAVESILSVPAGRTLTVEAGAVFVIGITGQTNGEIDVYGNLDVSGTAVKPVVFTSADGANNNGAPGDWFRIQLYPGATANFDYAEIYYSGASTGAIYAEAATLLIEDSIIGWSGGNGVYALDTDVTLKDSVLHDNQQDGIRVVTDTDNVSPIIKNNQFNRNLTAGNLRFIAPQPSVFTASGNTGADNDVNALVIEGTLGNMTFGANPSISYVFESIIIPNGVTVSADPGVVFKLDQAFSNGGGRVDLDGTLTLNGTPADPIVFTSLQDDTHGGDTNNDSDRSTPSAGDWRGISVGSSGSINANYTEVHYAGYDNVAAIQVLGGETTFNNGEITNNLSAGVYYQNTAPDMTDNFIADNGGEAVIVRFISGAKGGVVLVGNTGEGNGMNGILFNGDLLSSVLGANPGLPYVVEAMTVRPNNTVTVLAGTVIKLSRSLSASGAQINVDGVLDTRGTEGSPVVFTSLFDNDFDGVTPPGPGAFRMFMPLMKSGNGTTSSQNHHPRARTQSGRTETIPNSSPPERGDWRSIAVHDTGTINLDYTIIRYGGYPNIAQLQVLDGIAIMDHGDVQFSKNHGIYAEDAAVTIRDSYISNNNGFGLRIFGDDKYLEPLVTDNEFSNNSTYGMYLILNGGGMGDGEVSGNTGAGNGMVNGVYMEGYITDNISRFDVNPNFPWVIWTLYINEGKKLTLEPGVVMKFTNPPSLPEFNRGTGSALIWGRLDAIGTAAEPIVFTSYWDDTHGGDTNGSYGGTNPAAGDWWAFVVDSNATVNLDHTIFHYGGGDGMHIRTNGGTVNMDHSEIAFSSGNGVGGVGPLYISNSVIRNNQRNGIQLNAPGAIHWNSIFNNGLEDPNEYYGMINLWVPDTGYVAPAQNNYWGHSTGPATDGAPCGFETPSGLGDTISCRVGWDPYLPAMP